MMVELLIATSLLTGSHHHYTPEGYEIQRFDCNLTVCYGIDGSFLGRIENVANVIPAVAPDHVNNPYRCDLLCYDAHGLIVGRNPHMPQLE